MIWPYNHVTGPFIVPQTFLLPRHGSALPAVRQYLWGVCQRTPQRKSSGKCLTNVGRSPPSERARRTSATSASVRSSWQTRLFTCQVSTFLGKYNASSLQFGYCFHLFVLVCFFCCCCCFDFYKAGHIGIKRQLASYLLMLALAEQLGLLGVSIVWSERLMKCQLKTIVFLIKCTQHNSRSASVCFSTAAC